MNPVPPPAPSAHPLLRLLLAHPELLAEHAAAYAALAAEDGEQWLQRWRRQATLQGLALTGAFLGVSLAAQAFMLGTLLAPLDAGAWAVLLLTPLLPLALALVCYQSAAGLRPREPRARAFAALQRQLAADLALLRDAAGAPAPASAPASP